MYEYELQQASALCRDGEIYIPAPWVRTILNPRFYWESSEQLLSYVFPDGVRRIRPEEKDGAGRKMLLTGEDGKAWISASLVEELTDVRIERFTDGEVRRIFISMSPETDSVAATKRKTAVRAGKSWRRKITAEAPKGAKLRLIPDHPGRGEETEEDKKWQRVMTENGVTGYVLKKTLKEAEEVPFENDFREMPYPSKSVQPRSTDASKMRLMELVTRLMSPELFFVRLLSILASYEVFKSTVGVIPAAARVALFLAIWALLREI